MRALSFVKVVLEVERLPGWSLREGAIEKVRGGFCSLVFFVDEEGGFSYWVLLSWYLIFVILLLRVSSCFCRRKNGWEGALG